MGKIGVTIFRLNGLISLSQKLTITVNGKEKPVRIQYKGGSSNGKTIIGGRYISKDADVTAAIKASQRFKDKQIVVEKEYEETVESASASEQKADFNPTPSGVNGLANQELVSEEVTSTQKAKEFMYSKGTTQEELNKVISAGDVAKLAKEKGFVFPNWDAFKTV